MSSQQLWCVPELQRPPPPVDVQVTQCQQFIDWTVRRIEELDRSRAAESVLLQEARDRLLRFREAAAVQVTVLPVVVPDLTQKSDTSQRVGLSVAGTVGQVRGRFCRSGHGGGDSGDSNEETGPTRMFRVPHNGRTYRVDGCSSIRHAGGCRSGQCARNQQVGSVVSRGGGTVEELDSEPVHGQQHGDMMCDSEVPSWRTMSARYGLRGVRIGEVSHPGPPSLRRLRRRRSAPFEISSDEEPLMLSTARNMVPRVAGVDSVPAATQIETRVSSEDELAVPSTIPASPAPVRDKLQPASVPSTVFASTGAVRGF